MIYRLDEILTIAGIQGIVAYVNNGSAWIKPIPEYESQKRTFNGKNLLSGVVFAKLDSNGRVISESGHTLTAIRMA